MKSLLHNKNYLLYNTKNSFVDIGYNIYQITIPAYSFIYSHSIIFTGIILFVEYGIYALTFLVGPMVDKVEDRRYLILVSLVLIGISALLLSFLINTGKLDEVILIVLVGIMAVGHDILWTADWTVIPIVVEKDDIARATGYSSAIENASSVFGLILGGILIIYLNATFSMLTYAFLIFGSAFIILFLPLKLRADEKEESEGMVRGWKYVLKDRPELLRLAIILSFISYFSLLPVIGITDIFASSSSFYYSVTFSAFYIGAILSGIVIGKYFPKMPTGKTIFASGFLIGVLLIGIIALVNTPNVDTVLWLILGFFFSAYYTLYGIYLKITTPKGIIGRTASNLYIFRGISTAIGAITLPILFVLYGLKTVFLFSGISITIFIFIIFMSVPSLRNISVKYYN